MGTVLNPQASEDARHARGGKDAAIYDSDGNLMARVTSFQAQANIQNSSYNVLGNPQSIETPSSYTLNITLEETVIESPQMLADLINFMNGADVPVYTMQGTIRGREKADGTYSEERIMYQNVMPSGNIDLQNIQVGDTIKRQWNFISNGKPKLISTLTI